MLSLFALSLVVSSDVEVTRADLEAHVRYLSSDELAGRETGSDGGRLAAEYIARELERAQWRPAGDAGTFLQDVQLERHVAVAQPSLLAVGAGGEVTEGEARADFRVRSSGSRAGTFALVVVRTAEDVPSDRSAEVALFVDASRRDAYALLEEAGVPDGQGFGALLLPGPSSRGEPSEALYGPRLVPRSSGAPGPAVLSLRGPWVDEFQAGRIAEVRFDAGVRIEAADAANVVGVLPGRGDEIVVLSAHYDHIGTREPSAAAAEGAPEDIAEDLVYNGADDDASGVATVLEIAAALAAEDPLERTIVALLVTGEERGLLGTHFYLEHPFGSLEATVCNLNFEMVGRPDELVGGAGFLWLTGWERTNLGATWGPEHAILPDPRPEQSFFQRSDNYPFAQRGIVAQTLSSYGMHSDYHRVSDEVETLDFEHMERIARTSLDVVRGLASGATKPAWLPGGRP